MPVAVGAWWDTAKDHEWPKGFSIIRDGGREQGRVMDTYWERGGFPTDVRVFPEPR